MMAESANIFHIAVSRILSGWTALQLAAAHGFGGQQSHEKAEWMLGAVTEWFNDNSGIEPWELEEFIGDIMDAEFQTVIDDGSVREISESICGCYDLYRRGQTADLEARISRMPSADLRACQRVQTAPGDDESSDDDTDAMDTSQTQENVPSAAGDQSGVSMEADETRTDDGKTADDEWTYVSRKSKKR